MSMQKRLLLFFSLTFLVTCSVHSTHLDIRIFYEENIAQTQVRIHAGNYQLFSRGLPYQELKKDNQLEITAQGDSLKVMLKGTQSFYSTKLEFKGKSFINSINIRKTNGTLRNRKYDDDLFIEAKDGKIIFTNHVELEHYVAGVVQGESGSSSSQIEYFFVQAIISRTYALVNYLKHKDEGFNLCDGVHCQYYLGRNTNADISRAVARTQGSVIVDKEKKMISAAFHSNCGGQTVNSEDIWTIPTSYLKSIQDSFCLEQSNARWQKKIAIESYNAFLSKYEAQPLVNKKQQGQYIVQQATRKVKDSYSIPLKDYRQYFNLRSTWFDMQVDGDSLLLQGKGYGHGVGLCQQGAIEMIQRGYSYQEVIEHYYTDVEIIHYSELHYNFMP